MTLAKTTGSGSDSRSTSRGVTPSPSDLSGWPLDPRERLDFYHRIRAFPPDVSAWRQRLVRRVLQDPGRFGGIEARATKETIRERLDEGISALREIARILAAVHGTPRLGNKEDPVDELVYIILAADGFLTIVDRNPWAPRA